MNDPGGKVRGGTAQGSPKLTLPKLFYWHATYNVAIKQSAVIMIG